MLNRYPAWKNILVILVTVAGILIALPNLYGDDPAVQVSQTNGTVTEATTTQVEQALDAAKLPYTSAVLDDNRLLVRFDTPDTQMQALGAISKALGNQYSVALNLAPRTPAWMRTLGLKPMARGLDLQGGVHFQMLVDVNAAVQTKLQRDAADIRSTMRQQLIRYEDVALTGENINMQLRTPDDVTRAEKLLSSQFQELTVTAGSQPNTLVATIDPKQLQALRQTAVEQNMTVLRNRVNQLGVADPVVQQQGGNSIVVELPGVQDTARAKEILGAIATIEFRLVDPTANALLAEQTGHIPLDDQLFKDKAGNPVLLRRDVIVTGDQLVDASSGFDQQNGLPDVNVSLNSAGASKMGEVTRENLGKPMAVLYIETKTENTTVNGQTVPVHKKTYTVINVATIQGIFSGRFQITGLQQQEAQNLALLLRAGSLAAPMDIVQERTVGPSLGQENIRQGFHAALLGFLLVVIFIGLYYKTFGVIADLAVIMNLVLTVALLSLIQATLTLPGIAGIALTLGMGVDANVLINEHIREEVRAGNTPQAAIHAGYKRAFATIVDAHVTTLTAAVMLFLFGAGPVKGFAVTLSLGILTSLFTAIMGTRSIVNWVYGGRNLKKLPV
ncbi:MAG: protein translocase subunit SecD [Gammaproteobacteria bacterium]|nr:protein translocase subunit SecD [Gammaproteobacteria bacterium]MDE2139777.1 protein translocase subunit SecD [Gammaproteobacteria bacterium]